MSETELKDRADYSLYECPYSHVEKECGHELHGPEGYQDTYSVWCQCGFRGPVFYLEPDELGLKLKARADQPRPAPTPVELLEALKHGDEVHRQWLYDALHAVFEGSPVPEPRQSQPRPAVPDGYALVPEYQNVDEIVTAIYRRFKEWSKRGFGPDDVTWCEVKADIQAMVSAAQQPEGGGE